MLSQKLKEIRKLIKPTQELDEFYHPVTRCMSTLKKSSRSQNLSTSEKIGPKLANGAGKGKAESTKEPLEGAYKRTT